MILRCKEKQSLMIEKYIGKEYYKCLYLYMNLKNYGINSQIIKVYMDESDGEIRAIYLIYFSCVHVYSRNNNFNMREFEGLLQEHLLKMIYCEKSTAEYIWSNYTSSKNKLSITYGWVAEATDVDKRHKEKVQMAAASDFEQIIAMIYGDEDIGKSYYKDELAKQLFQRSQEKYSRNYVIKKDDLVIAHACTNAELDGIAVVAEIIVNEQYRKRGHASEILCAICEDLLNEEKRVFSFYYSNESRMLHKKVGFHEICEWGKIVFEN